MESRKTAISAVFIGLLMCASASMSMAAVNCSDAVQHLSTCLPFLLNGSPVPSHKSPCCAGVQNIYSNGVSNIQDRRRDLCECIKTAAVAYGVNDNALRTLAPDCGIQLPYTVSKNIDCNSIQ